MAVTSRDLQDDPATMAPDILMVQTLTATTSPTKNQGKADESIPAAWFFPQLN